MLTYILILTCILGCLLLAMVLLYRVVQLRLDRRSAIRTVVLWTAEKGKKAVFVQPPEGDPIWVQLTEPLEGDLKAGEPLWLYQEERPKTWRKKK